MAQQTSRRSTAKPAAPARPTEASAKRSLELVMRLLKIPGTSGQEGKIVAYLQKRLLAVGAPASAMMTDAAHRRSPIGGQVGNLILRLPGTYRAPRRMLMAHLDTVPICAGARPVRKGNLIRSADPQTGLGADDRAGVAVTLNTALEILRRGLPHPPLTFLWCVQEEVGLFGSRLVRKSALGNPRWAFNWDGGAAEKLTIGATGGYRMKIDLEGRASHAGGAPEQGVSAIAIAALAIDDLYQRGWHGEIVKPEGTGTSNVGVISGGQATNVVTDRVHLRAEARSHDPRFRKQIVREFEQAFHRAAKQVQAVDGTHGRAMIEGRLDYEAFRLPPDSPVVQAAMAAVQAVGATPQLAVANGGLDANWITAHGIPTVSLGCGQKNIHTVAETLDIRVFQQACQIALRLATESD